MNHTSSIAIDQADLLVSGGRGIKSEDDFAVLGELAQLLDGQLAASRPPVDQGWLPHEQQIGQSGTTVKPACIINVGISGSVQYQVGMQNSGCIISMRPPFKSSSQLTPKISASAGIIVRSG